jgi:hypothetical protein
MPEYVRPAKQRSSLRNELRLWHPGGTTGFVEDGLVLSDRSKGATISIWLPENRKPGVWLSWYKVGGLDRQLIWVGEAGEVHVSWNRGLQYMMFPAPLTERVHVVMVYQEGLEIFYINGQQVDTMVCSPVGTWGDRLRVGGGDFLGWLYCGVWFRLLSPEEVGWLWKGGTGLDSPF